MAWLELHDILARAPRPLCNPLIKRPVSIRSVQIAVAAHFKLPVEIMTWTHRSWSEPRQIAMFICYGLTDKPMTVIGRHFGDRDHSTVVHACRKIERMCQKDTEFAKLIDELTGLVEG